MSSLPNDIIVDILVRLPVKFLVQLRCISKSWRSILSDPHFVKLHLNRVTRDLDSSHSRLLTLFPARSLDFESPLAFDADADAHDVVVELGFPLKEPQHGIKIVGSCNGLVCLLYDLNRVILWNPSTKDSRELPASPCSPSGVSFYGFGYDSSSDDYKVVIAALSRTADETKVCVYDLKGKSWRQIKEGLHNTITVLDDLGAFLNGALHWRASQDFGPNNRDVIVSLDLEKEKFRVILGPHVGDRNISFHTLGVSNGCLSLCSYGYGLNLCIWVMKEYGVRTSWSKLISLRSCEFDYCDYMVPVCFTKKGEVVVDLDGRKLVKYDVKDKASRYLSKWNDGWNERVVYMESLVSPHPTEDVKGHISL